LLELAARAVVLLTVVQPSVWSSLVLASVVLTILAALWRERRKAERGRLCQVEQGQRCFACKDGGPCGVCGRRPVGAYPGRLRRAVLAASLVPAVLLLVQVMPSLEEPCRPIRLSMPTPRAGIVVETYVAGSIAGWNNHIELYEDGRVVARSSLRVLLAEQPRGDAAARLRALAAQVAPFRWPETGSCDETSDPVAEGFLVFGEGSRTATADQRAAIHELVRELREEVRTRLREVYPDHVQQLAGEPW
jgi:hypothetical protein